MERATVNGVELNYTIAGHGRPLLFIHGLGSSLHDWEPQVERFSRTNKVIAVDLRGHGESEITQGAYTIPLFAADLAALVEHLGTGPVVPVGISLGGGIAFQLGADFPELVEALVIVNSVQGFELKTFRQRFEIFMRKAILKFMGMRKMGEVLAPKLFPGDDMQPQRELLVERWAKNDKDSYRRALMSIVNWEGVVEAMKLFPKPILMVHAEHDYAPLEAKQPYLDQLPTATLVEIPGAHHAVPMEYPEAFNEVLAEFLAG